MWLLTVGEQSVGVGVVQSLGGAESGSGRVAVAQVIGAGNLGQVSGLVKGGGGLILGVAGVRGGGQSAEVQGAVDDLAGRGGGVGQDVAGAGREDVAAVGAGRAAAGAAALGDNLGEDRGHAGADRCRLEVLVDLGGVAQGSRRCRRGEGSAGGDRISASSKLAASAVGLDSLFLGAVRQQPCP